MEVAEIIFWSSSLALAFFYLDYYALCKYVVKSKTFDVKKNKKFRPKVSFVIPTWNEENTIEGKLKNTLALQYPKDKLEVIVIDSGSTDRTREIVKKFKKVKLLSEKERSGKARALNKAFKHCSGDIVVISDADCRLDKSVLLKSMPYFSNPSVGAVTGRESIINPDENLVTKTEKTYRDFFYLIRSAESVLDSTYVFDGPFCAFRRELLDEIDSRCVADDSELAMRIKKKGYRTLSIPEAIYFEYAPSKLSDRTKQKSRRAEGLIQSMVNFFSTFFLNPRYGLFGLLIFPAGVFMHVVSPFLLIAAIITFFLLPSKLFVTLLSILAIALLIPSSRSFILAFLHSQYACLVGVLNYAISKPNYSWEKIEGTRRYGKC
jgi:cellulose synthase/poly-beta-1,6-N-acetylglucosamine synthase-like glycosyltransferase